MGKAMGVIAELISKIKALAWQVKILSRWEWICQILDGKEVSEFALSFPEVARVKTLVDLERGLGVAGGKRK
jgi:hypothetical protein